MRLSDRPTLGKIDQAYHAPFLTACIAALTAHGYLSEMENEQLRIQLKDRHKSPDGLSLFHQLAEDKSSAFDVLQARLGPHTFSALLFRWTTAKALENFNYAIWSVAQELLSKAELMFNQPFHLYAGKACIQRGPFSYFLVEIAGELHKNGDELHESVRALKTWSQERATEDGFEATLANHLGFTTDDDVGLADWKLHELLQRTWLRLELLAEFSGHILSQISANLRMNDEEPRLRFLLEDFQSLLGSFKGAAAIDFSTMAIMESKRLRILGAIQECKDIAAEFFHILLSTLKTTRIPIQAPNVWPESEARSIINHLLDRGLPIADARSALQALESYCQGHAVSPEQLLDAELLNIHPYFDSGSSLFLKRASASDTLSEAFQEEKQQIVHKKDRLAQSINHRLLGITLGILFCLSFLPACGVKTAPRSDVLDLRPTVPYHAEQRNYPKKKADEPLAPAPK